MEKALIDEYERRLEEINKLRDKVSKLEEKESIEVKESKEYRNLSWLYSDSLKTYNKLEEENKKLKEKVEEVGESYVKLATENGKEKRIKSKRIEELNDELENIKSKWWYKLLNK